MNTIIKPSKKYYSIKAIGIATFLGGPLVAGYLISLISLLIMGGSIMAYAFYGPSSKAYDDYAIEMESFMKNEEEGLVVFDHFDTNSTFELITEIKNTTIPKWEENIEIINKSNQIADLPTELKERNLTF